MRIVIAPDSFKGSATAADAAAALAEGWRSVRPGDEVVLAPMADGGEGTVSAVAAAVAGSAVFEIEVVGPDDRPTLARWLLLPPADGPRTALVELAEGSGLLLLDELRPLEAHTVGFGQLIAAALEAGAQRVLLAIGGSSSTDGGAGALRALGARLLDADGRDIPLGNRGLAELAAIDLDGVIPPPSGGAVVLSDVDNPLLGPRGAVAVFGQQKGVDATLAPAAEAALARFADELAALTGASPHTPGTGAAGGAGFGLLAWGAELTSGARAIADAIGLAAAIAGADLVITGEGRFDGQSEGGKAPVIVAELALAGGVPCDLVAGAITAEPHGFEHSRSLTELAGSTAEALANPLHWLRRAGEELAASR